MSAAEDLHLFDLEPELVYDEDGEPVDPQDYPPGVAAGAGTYVAVLRVVHRLEAGDELLPDAEWAYRLSAMGLSHVGVSVQSYEPI